MMVGKSLLKIVSTALMLGTFIPMNATNAGAWSDYQIKDYGAKWWHGWTDVCVKPWCRLRHVHSKLFHDSRWHGVYIWKEGSDTNDEKNRYAYDVKGGGEWAVARCDCTTGEEPDFYIWVG